MLTIRNMLLTDVNTQKLTRADNAP